jgi:hypothetical protein
MVNDKYDNLAVMLANGQLNWANDVVVANLVAGATFDATDVTMADLGVPIKATVPIQGRSVAENGSLLGRAVSFNYIPKDTDFQVVIAKDYGPGVQNSVIAFYDTDLNGDPLRLKNNGTLILRPGDSGIMLPTEDTGQGVWVTI